MDPEKRLKAVEARKDPWVNSVAPLPNHKGHSSKYLSSQVSGKSVKSSITFRSPLVRHRRFEDESGTQSHGSHDNERNARHLKRHFDQKSGSDSSGEKRHQRIASFKGNDEGKIPKDYQKTEVDGYSNGGMVTSEAKEKSESVPASFQEEFPSAAATEDSNSLASRIDRNESEQEFATKEFTLAKVTPEEAEIARSPPNFALNRFMGGADLLSEWPGRENLSYIKDSEEPMTMKEKLNHRRDELDLLFSPLQRSNLRWHMQEDTSVKDKVGLWLEGQNGHYRDDRLSVSSGVIDQISRSEFNNRDLFNQSEFQKGFPGLSASSSPIKHSYAAARNILPNVKLKNRQSMELSPQVSLSEQSDSELPANGAVLNKHSTLRPISDIDRISDNLQSVYNGLEMRNLQRKGYNDSRLTSYQL